MAREIELTQGYKAIVDDDDYESLSQFDWCVLKTASLVYAIRGLKVIEGKGPNKKVLMHRQIMKPESVNVLVDHIDGNTLNNQRSNLRLATKAQNLRNMALPTHNTSGYKGASWDKARRLWAAYISVKSRKVHLGRYATAEDAASAYNTAVVHYSGEFARLNKVKEGAINEKQVSKPVRERERRLQASRKPTASRAATKRRA